MAKTQRLVIQIFGCILLLVGAFIIFQGITYFLKDSKDYENTLKESVLYTMFGSFSFLGLIIMFFGQITLMAFRDTKTIDSDTALWANQTCAFISFIYFVQLSLFMFFEADQILKIFSKNVIKSQNPNNQKNIFKQQMNYFVQMIVHATFNYQTLKKYPEKFQGKVYTTDEEGQDKIIRVQLCEQEFNFTLYYINCMMEFLERYYQCTGWCSPSSYFIFSDINDNSVTEKSCFEELQSQLEKNQPIITYIFIELTFLSGYVIIFSISFFFQRKTNIKDELRDSDSDSEYIINYTFCNKDQDSDSEPSSRDPLI